MNFFFFTIYRSNFTLYLARIPWSIWLYWPLISPLKNLSSLSFLVSRLSSYHSVFSCSHGVSWLSWPVILYFQNSVFSLFLCKLSSSNGIHSHNLLSAYNTGSIISILCVSYHLIITTCIKCGYYNYPHFTGEKTGAYRIQVTWPRSQLIMVKLRLTWPTDNTSYDPRAWSPTFKLITLTSIPAVQLTFLTAYFHLNVLTTVQIQCVKRMSFLYSHLKAIFYQSLF